MDSVSRRVRFNSIEEVRDGYSEGTSVDMYETMVRIRRFEERIRELYFADKLPAFDIAAGLIPGEMHLAAGQEPVAVGMRPHLHAGDAITATHRPTTWRSPRASI